MEKLTATVIAETLSVQGCVTPTAENRERVRGVGMLIKEVIFRVYHHGAMLLLNFLSDKH